MNDVRWLDEDEQRAWRAFLRMHARLAARLHRQLQDDSGLSLADYEVLVTLTDAPEGSVRPFALQRSLQWEQSRLSHHLTRMQRRGLITREHCPDDRRGAFVSVTAAGRRAIEAAAPGHVETVRRCFFDQLTPDQIDALEQISTRALELLDRSDEPATAPS